MRRPGILAITLPIIFIALVVPGRSQERKPDQKVRARPFDENRFPIADYAAPDQSNPAERAKRHSRGKKYDKSHWNIYPEMQFNGAQTHALNLNLPALPITQSSAVIVGPVTAAKAYLSNDKTGVYSVFTVQIHEVFKNSSPVPMSTGSSIEVERDGGRVRFLNGRVLIYVATNMPQVGLRHLLFLSNPAGQSDLQIVTGYELRDDKVYPLDDLPNLNRYENADETVLLNELRTKVANP